MSVEINTIEELDAIRGNLNLDYTLARSLDFNTEESYSDPLNMPTYTSGDGWEPLGRYLTDFTGSFDGQGYKIYNIFINRPTEEDVGLFGSIDNGNVSDVHLKHANVTAYLWGGLLSGYLWGISATISSCSSSGTITGEGYIGGLLGSTGDGSLSKCKCNTDIFASDISGGMIGAIFETTVNDCYATGSITRTSGSIDLFGGFAGDISSSTVNRCFSTTLVKSSVAPDMILNGFAGSVLNSTLNNNYWNTETSNQPSSAGGVGVSGKTTAEMTSLGYPDCYENYDFPTIWIETLWNFDQYGNRGYPALSWETYSGPGDSPWPLPKQNNQSRGRSPIDTTTNDGHLKWMKTLAGSPGLGHTTIGDDYKIYVVGDDTLFALDEDGNTEWSKSGHGLPLIATNGDLILSSSAGIISRMDRGGTVIWSHSFLDIADTASVSLFSDGLIYGELRQTGSPTLLYCLDGEGNRKWVETIQNNKGMAFNPAENTIYILDNFFDLYAHDIKDGSAKWTISLDIYGNNFAGPSVSEDGTIYAPGKGGLYAINPDGTEKWRYSFHADYGQALDISIQKNGNIVFVYGPNSSGSATYGLMCVDTDGNLLWRTSFALLLARRLAVDETGHIFCSVGENSMRCYNPNGSLKWNKEAHQYAYFNRPTINRYGTVYIGTGHGRLYAFTSSVSPVNDLTVYFSAGGTVKDQDDHVFSNSETKQYDTGTLITLTGSENPIYKFTGWSGDVSSTDNPVSFQINEDMEIICTFTPIMVIRINYNIRKSIRIITEEKPI